MGILLNDCWASEMVQQVETLAAKPRNLNLISETHVVEGENRLSQVVH